MKLIPVTLNIESPFHEGYFQMEIYKRRMLFPFQTLATQIPNPFSSPRDAPSFALSLIRYSLPFHPPLLWGCLPKIPLVAIYGILYNAYQITCIINFNSTPLWLLEIYACPLCPLHIYLDLYGISMVVLK